VRRFPKRMSSWVLLLLPGGTMSAQPPTVAVNDYLKEVRGFPSTSAEFSQAASSLGVSASLATLGAGQSLIVAIRNDSGGPVEARILFQLTKGGKTTPRDLYFGYSLAAGAVTLIAPREINGALAGLLHAGKPGLVGFTGSPTAQPLDDFNGATVTASVDSATLSDGKFIGADTQKAFPRLVAEHNAKKKFFNDLAGMAGQSQAQINHALTARKAAADAAKGKMTDLTDLDLAAQTEAGLAQGALMQLQYFGMASLTSWVEKENAALASKPSIHK
jgi:hypothetical protein